MGHLLVLSCALGDDRPGLVAAIARRDHRARRRATPAEAEPLAGARAAEFADRADALAAACSTSTRTTPSIQDGRTSAGGEGSHRRAGRGRRTTSELGVPTSHRVNAAPTASTPRWARRPPMGAPGGCWSRQPGERRRPARGARGACRPADGGRPPEPRLTGLLRAAERTYWRERRRPSPPAGERGRGRRPRRRPAAPGPGRPGCPRGVHVAPESTDPPPPARSPPSWGGRRGARRRPPRGCSAYAGLAERAPEDLWRPRPRSVPAAAPGRSRGRRGRPHPQLGDAAGRRAPAPRVGGDGRAAPRRRVAGSAGLFNAGVALTTAPELDDVQVELERVLDAVPQPRPRRRPRQRPAGARARLLPPRSADLSVPDVRLSQLTGSTSASHFSRRSRWGVSTQTHASRKRDDTFHWAAAREPRGRHRWPYSRCDPAAPPPLRSCRRGWDLGSRAGGRSDKLPRDRNTRARSGGQRVRRSGRSSARCCSHHERRPTTR